MPIKRFNWDKWDTVVTESDGTREGDINRKDNTYTCSSEIPGISSSPSGSQTIVIGLSGCQLFMPPRINEINILPSSQLEIFIYGEGIQ